MKEIFLSTLQSGWFRFFLILIIVCQATSFIARKIEKAYHRDLEWETPPDRLPDMVDLYSAASKQEARIQRVLRQLQTKDFTIQSLDSVLAIVSEIEEAAPEMKAYIQEIHTVLDAMKYTPRAGEEPAQTTLTDAEAIASIGTTKKISAYLQAYLDLTWRILTNQQS